MGREPCEVAEVTGENAVGRLLKLCGHDTDPSKCDTNTVRGRFGIRQAQIVGSAFYFKNAIHRPKTEEEACRDLSLFRKLLQDAD
jgi:nucleoside diphosphate kinase